MNLWFRFLSFSRKRVTKRSGRLRLLGGLLGIAVSILVPLLCLFADGPALQINGTFHSILHEVVTTFRDSGTQWTVFLCLSVSFLTFLLLDFSQNPQVFRRPGNPSLWLAFVLFAGTLTYSLDYATASQSTEALTLLAGVVLGQGVVIWFNFKRRTCKAESGKTPDHHCGNNPEVLSLSIFVVLLTVASFWKPYAGYIFVYRGHSRWSGPWDNPNVFGMLMALGVVLAVSIFAFCILGKSGNASWKFTIKTSKVALLCIVAEVLMARGLLHSYSRGAWVATFCGLGYLTFQLIRYFAFAALRQGNPVSGFSNPESGSAATKWKPGISCSSCVSSFAKNWLPLSLILASVFALAFWHFRQTEWHPARRAFSMGNANDFSWRNRVAAWEGTLQMMAEKPWVGFGWNQPEPMYDNYYRPPKVSEGRAIQMNDYFILGATLGLPALFCFGAHLWLGLTQKLKTGNGQPEIEADWIKTTYRAGAIVLAVGFWFDGGLFKLPTASVFWILLELGRRGGREFRQFP